MIWRAWERRPARAVLQEAGLQRVLGSHLEVFADGQRSVRGRHDWQQSLQWLELAARAGLRVQPAILYGQDETPEDLGRRLLDVRTVAGKEWTG